MNYGLVAKSSCYKIFKSTNKKEIYGNRIVFFFIIILYFTSALNYGDIVNEEEVV